MLDMLFREENNVKIDINLICKRVKISLFKLCILIYNIFRYSIHQVI